MVGQNGLNRYDPAVHQLIQVPESAPRPQPGPADLLDEVPVPVDMKTLNCSFLLLAFALFTIWLIPPALSADKGAERLKAKTAPKPPPKDDQEKKPEPPKDEEKPFDEVVKD